MPHTPSRRPPAARSFRPSLTQLEDRSTPATFAEAGAALNLDLAAAESVGIVSGGTSYTFTLTGGTWTGTDSANVTGNGTGVLSVTAAGLAAFTAVNLTDSGAGAAVTFNDSGANAYSDHFTVTLEDTPGDVRFYGSSRFAANNLSVITADVVRVNFGSSVTCTSGNITLSANQQATPSTGFLLAIFVQGGSVTSDTGSVSLAGRSGTDGNGFPGVWMSAGATVGTTGAGGTVSVVGQGGTNFGGRYHGVLVEGANTKITSGGGAITVVGTGGGSGLANFSAGVRVVDGGQITAGGYGTVSVTGTGGVGADSFGVSVVGSGSRITSGGGSVTVTGIGGGTGSNRVAVVVEDNGVIGSGGNSTITVTADSVSINGTGRVNAGNGSVTFRPLTAGTRIDLGGADVLTGSPLALGLTDAELDRVTAGTLVLGSATAGSLTVSADVTRPAATNLQLVSGGDITLNAGVNTAGGTLTFTPGGVSFPKAGTDATASTTSFSGGQFRSNIAGLAADTQFTRLVADEAVNLSGVTLALTGGYVPLPGDSFEVVSAGSVVGTFAGLPNGASVILNGAKLWVVYTPTAVTLVANRPPAVTSASVTAGGVGGTPFTVSATATDPDGPTDPLTYSWVVTRGGVPVASGSGASFTFTPAAGGTHTVALTVTDTAGATATASRTIAVTPPPRVVTAVGNAVRVLNPLDGTSTAFAPFPGFGEPVTVATADLNGDGVLDVVTGAGPGGGPHVKVFDGATGAETASFYAFAPAFTGGVNVTAANGRVVVGAGAGGGPHVKQIDAARLGQVQADGQIADTALLANFYAYDPAFAGGVRVAVGDLNGDGVAEVVTGAGPGGGPHVKAFDGVTGAESLSFYAFDPAFTGGVFVAATAGRVVVGADAGGRPHVKLFDPAGTEAHSFYAYDPAFTGGVRVGFADADGTAGWTS